jgi:ubiquitin carboxyl-terminal hydrolase 47
MYDWAVALYDPA